MATKSQHLILLAGPDLKRKTALAEALKARNPRGLCVIPRLSEAARKTLIEGKPVGSLNSSEAAKFWLNALDFFYREFKDASRRASLDGFSVLVSVESPIDILAKATADMPAGLFPIESVSKRMKTWLRSPGVKIVDIPAQPSASSKRPPFSASEVEYHVHTSRFRRDGSLSDVNHRYALHAALPDQVVHVEELTGIQPPPNFSA